MSVDADPVSTVAPDVDGSCENARSVVKKQRFRFKEAQDIAMLQVVLKNNAYLAPHGRTRVVFEDVKQDLFHAGVFSEALDGRVPTTKTISDRYRHLLSVYRKGMLKQKGGRKEHLLRCIVAKINEKTGHMDAIDDSQSPKRKRSRDSYDHSPKDIPDGVPEVDVAPSIPGEDSEAPVSAYSLEPRAKRQTDDFERLDASDELLQPRLQVLKWELEKKRFYADERERKRRYDIEVKRAKIEEDRIALEHRRLDLELEEHKSEREEKEAFKKLITAMAEALLKK